MHKNRKDISVNRCDLIFVTFLLRHYLDPSETFLEGQIIFTWRMTIFVYHPKESLRASNLGVIPTRNKEIDSCSRSEMDTSCQS